MSGGRMAEELVARMLVWMFRNFSKHAAAHTDKGKTFGGLFIPLMDGLFCALGIICRNFERFHAYEYAVVTGNNRWAQN
jgi:hypothetical protein